MEYVVLVTSDDRIEGVEEKLLAHQKGSLHRAVSVCLFDEAGRWLLQKRASCKYHSPGKWANSCCSHPYLGELPLEAATRRVFEELGVSVALQPQGSFLYKEAVGSSLIEHEYDYVFSGRVSPSLLKPNPKEVEEVAFCSQDQIAEKLQNDPDFFAPWFQYVFQFMTGKK